MIYTSVNHDQLSMVIAVTKNIQNQVTNDVQTLVTNSAYALSMVLVEVLNDGGQLLNASTLFTIVINIHEELFVAGSLDYFLICPVGKVAAIIQIEEHRSILEVVNKSRVLVWLDTRDMEMKIPQPPLPNLNV